MKPHAKSVARVIASLPPAWQDELAGRAVAVVQRGLSGAQVLSIGGDGAPERYLKVAKGAAADDLRREIERTGWLTGQGLLVPKILRIHDAGRMVAVIVGALAGVTPDQCKLRTGEVVVRLAAAMVAFHAVPVEDCPYDETVAARLARAREDIARGAVDPDAFDPRNAGSTPKQLYRRLAASMPASEDIVVVHGDATFDNILIDRAGNVGFIDCGRAGRADRYVDLALVAAEIETHFGADWIAPFAQAYGLPSWNGAKARWFSDLYELF